MLTLITLMWLILTHNLDSIKELHMYAGVAYANDNCNDYVEYYEAEAPTINLIISMGSSLILSKLA